MNLMYYEFLVTHLDAPFLLLSAVTTGLIINVFYKKYQGLHALMKVIVSISLFLTNALILVPAIVFIYRIIMLCGLYGDSSLFDFSSCYDSSLNGLSHLNDGFQSTII